MRMRAVNLPCQDGSFINAAAATTTTATKNSGLHVGTSGGVTCLPARLDVAEEQRSGAAAQQLT